MCLIREFERYRPVLVSHQGFCSKGVKINNFSLYEENSAIRVENKLQDEDAQRQTVGCLKKKKRGENESGSSDGRRGRI